MEEERSSVLVVDDTDLNVDILTSTLEDKYDVQAAMDGKSAIDMVAASPPDIILLDVMMPGMDGYEVCAKLKADPATAGIPVIFLTAMTDINDKTRGFEMGAVDYIVKPFSVLEVLARLDVHLSLLKAHKALRSQNELLERRVRERTIELETTQDVIIEAMASLAETRDQETGDHVLRTRYYVQMLAVNLSSHPRFKPYLQGISPDELGTAATLHDIGKVGVPDSILLKPGRLTPEEFVEMKKHAVYGHDILCRISHRLPRNMFLALADVIAWSHHEKWDGTGYPRGLKGDDIPIPGRLMAIADVYDALVSKRVYKNSMDHSEAVDIIRSQSGLQFDPDVVESFTDLVDSFSYMSRELKVEDISEE